MDRTSEETKFVNKYFTDQTDKEKQRIIEQILVTDQDGYKDKKQMFLELLEMLPWNIKPGKYTSTED